MLHTVNKSPFEHNALNACLARAAKGSAILLFEDAVYAATEGTRVENLMVKASKDFQVFVLGPDLKARGYEKYQVIKGIAIVDYSDFVDIVVAHGPVTSWL